jgi:hypothetical protein
MHDSRRRGVTPAQTMDATPSPSLARPTIRRDGCNGLPLPNWMARNTAARFTVPSG